MQPNLGIINTTCVSESVTCRRVVTLTVASIFRSGSERQQHADLQFEATRNYIGHLDFFNKLHHKVYGTSGIFDNCLHACLADSMLC